MKNLLYFWIVETTNNKHRECGMFFEILDNHKRKHQNQN